MSSHQSCAPDCPRGPQSNFCGGRALCRPHSLDCGHTEDSEIAPPPPPPRGIQDTANLPVALSTRGFLWLIKAPEMVLEYCLRHLSPPCSCVFLLSSQLLQEEQTQGWTREAKEKSPLSILPRPISETFGKLGTMNLFLYLEIRTFFLLRYSPLSGSRD